MNCWKSVDAKKDLGSNRIFLISTMIGILTFIILYPMLTLIHPKMKIEETGLLISLFSLYLLPFIHVITHLIPFWITGKRCAYKLRWIGSCIPMLQFKVSTGTSKFIPFFSLLMPTILLTLPLLSAAIFLDTMPIYCILLVSLNAGMTFSDGFYLCNLLQAPRKCVIAGTDKSYDILVK
ncbi:metalloprotease family protein [Terribacillus saccharophilus]|uniref:metalloprotease family protein n=1 Tax=Terribacillus saccharophilus TaxID=361277 RepID=UPI003982B554